MRRSFLTNKEVYRSVFFIKNYVKVYTKNNDHLKAKEILNIIKEKNSKIVIFKVHRSFYKHNTKMTFYVQKRTLTAFKEVCTKEKWRVFENNLKVKDKVIKKSKCDKICSLNINHLASKKLDLEVLLSKEKPLIIGLQETRITEKYKPKIVGYQEFHMASKDNKNLGLCTLVKKEDNVRSCLLKSFENILITAIDLYTDKGWIRICVFNVYVPNGKINRYPILSLVCEEIKKMKKKRNFDEFIILGDFNMTGKSLSNLLGDLGFIVDVSQNRVRGSRMYRTGKLSKRVIDHIVRINTQDGEKAKISRKWKISDHLLIIRKFKFEKQKTENKLIFDRTALKEHSYIYKKAVKVLNLFKLTSKNAQKILYDMCVDLRLIKKKKPFTKAVFSRRFERLYKSHNRLVKLAVKLKDGLEELECSRISLLKQKYIERKKRQEKYSLKGASLFINRKSREWWKWIKGNIRYSNSVASVAINDNKDRLVFDMDEKLAVWEKYFRMLSSCVNEEDTYLNEPNINSVEEVTVEEVRIAAKSCGNNKAPGNDFLPSELLSKLISEDEVNIFMCFLLREFNELIKGKPIEPVWCETDIVAVFKKGDIYDVNNYRGIALVNSILKIFLKIVNYRLTQEIEELDIISVYQAGFRVNEEGIQHVATLLEVVKRREFSNKDTFICFIDFEKAYDNVDHGILFRKLKKIGISKYLVNVVKNLYKETRMKVKIGDLRSEGFKYMKGVRQGCPCSPMLFNIFINDVLDNMEGIDVPKTDLKIPGLMFADDIVLFGRSKEDIEAKIEKLCLWTKENKMKINSDKCGLLVWESNENGIEREPISIKTSFGDIFEVKSYKYLGISIQKKLMEEEIVISAGKKGNMLVHAMKNNFLNNNLSMYFKSILIKNVLIPTMLYGKELWGMSSVRAKVINTKVRKAYIFMLKSKNVAYDSVSDEFRIERTDIQAAKARIRALKKWKHSKTVIADLINQPFQGRKTTWASRGYRWMKRYLKISPTELDVLDSKIISRKVNDEFINRNSYLSSVSSQIRKKYKLVGFNYGILIKKAIQRDINTFTSLRISKVRWTDEMVARKLISERFRGICIVCEQEKEDLNHFLIRCDFYSLIKAKFGKELDKLIKIARNDTEVLVGLILGNRNFCMSLEENRDVIVKMVTMMNEMIRLRAIFVRNEMQRHAA